MISVKRLKYLILAFLLIFSSTGVLAQSRSISKDSIYLYNGQILIGEIQGANLGLITIDDLDLKMQNVKLYKIRRLVVRDRFKIETVSKGFYYGRLIASPNNGWVNVQSDDGKIFSMPLTDLYMLIALDRNFFKRLSGNLAAGFSYTKSSGVGQVNLSTSVTFATEHADYQLSASELGSIDSGRFSRDNENLQLFVSRDLSATWFIAASTQYQRNLELSLARRYLELLGVGNKLVIRTDWQLMAITGVNLTQEKSTDGASANAQFEIPIMFRFNFYKFRHPNIQITSTQTGYISLSESGRFRYDGSTQFSWELVRYFYITLSPYTNFDSKPPLTGASGKFDYGIVFNISYKF